MTTSVLPPVDLDGFHATFFVCAALPLAGAIAALFTRDRDAADTVAPLP